MFNSSSNPTLTDTTVCGNTPDQIDGDYTDLGGNCILEECGDDLNGNGIPTPANPALATSPVTASSMPLTSGF